MNFYEMRAATESEAVAHVIKPRAYPSTYAERHPNTTLLNPRRLPTHTATWTVSQTIKTLMNWY